MKKHALFLLVMIGSAAIVWSQEPQLFQPIEPEFAWLDDPVDEELIDFEMEAPEPPLPPLGGGVCMATEGPIAEKLNLTDEQKKTMKEMRLKQQKELIPLQAELRSKHLDLQSELQANMPDRSKINALVDQISKLRADIQKKHIALRLDLRAQLTPEQLKIWNENKGRAMRKFMHERRGAKGHFRCDRPAHGPF